MLRCPGQETNDFATSVVFDRSAVILCFWWVQVATASAGFSSVRSRMHLGRIVDRLKIAKWLRHAGSDAGSL